jgi:hypothetical protein
MSPVLVYRNRRVHRDDPEPALADLLDDPVTHAVMRRDGVTRQVLIRTIENARARLAQGARAAVPADTLCCA